MVDNLGGCASSEGVHHVMIDVTPTYVEETGDWVADCESCVFFSGCCKAEKALALIK